ncbi:MAG: tRNA (adenosine(37)-N6)-threonylcarbamoyltransferase complex dimerization subunit type 1 TsaB [Blastocatellia bacterium]
MDTSSRMTGLCVLRNGEVVKRLNEPFDEKRSEKLWIAMEGLLCDVGLTLRDVDLFAVCVGPGGFTGLRVGVAAAKGLAVAAGKPMVGVTSLEAAAASGAGDLPVVALVNAYKREVYSQLFSFDGEGALVAENEPLVSTFRVALDRVKHVKKLMFVGDAAIENDKEIRRLAREIGDDGNSQFRAWATKGSDSSSVEAIARLALSRYLKGGARPPEHIAACYVRPAEAEIKLAQGLLGSKIERSRRKS